MANIISADAVLSGGGGLYLTAEDKAELHAEQRPFYIIGAVAEQDGQYGTQTVFTIKEKDKEEMRLAFAVNAQRTEQARKISQHLANGADGVGPFYLGRWENGGRSGWTLTNAPTTPLAIPPSSTEQAVQEKADRVAKFDATVSDDDLPF
jgi:hypothetical protein